MKPGKGAASAPGMVLFVRRFNATAPIQIQTPKPRRVPYLTGLCSKPNTCSGDFGDADVVAEYLILRDELARRGSFPRSVRDNLPATVVARQQSAFDGKT